MGNYPYLKIKDDIKKRILESEWLGDTRLPSSRDFAAFYGSSVNTVEKAIKELCAEGLLKRDNRRGTYIESGVLSPFGKSRTGLVAASVLGIENPLWATALRGIEDVLRLHGFHLLSYSDDRSLDRLESLVKGAVAKRVDGVILSPIFNRGQEERNLRIYDTLRSNNIKTVFLDRYLYDRDIPFVTSDNAVGAYRLGKLLLAHGHRRILFVRNSNPSTFSERLLGLKQAYLDAGLVFPPEMDYLLPTEQENFEGEFDAYCERLEPRLREPDYTAVFTANDQLAEAVMTALGRIGKRIPKDVSLVTYDALNLGRKLKLDVSGINQPFYEMGRTAALQLMSQIEGTSHTSLFGQICKGELNRGATIASVEQQGREPSGSRAE